MLDTITNDVAEGGDATILTTIDRSTCALAVWHRPLPVALDEVDLDPIDDLAIEVTAEVAGDTLAPALIAAGYPVEVADALAGDVALVCRLHAARSPALRLAIRLEVVETDACRRFHADYVAVRTLCTYRGPATQWRRADHERIEQVPTGAVAMVKGRLLLDPPPVLHRSPPIAAAGDRRLVLVVDDAPAAALG